MKYILASLAVALVAAVTAHAEAPYYSFNQGAGDSGSGFYFGLQGGVNLYQDTDSAKASELDIPVSGLNFSTKSNVGGFGGLKFGYASDSTLGVVRPAVEFDGFYNGCSQDMNAEYRGSKKGVGNVDLNSGAFLINGIFRFALGSVQPYVGVGAGFYTAEFSGELLGIDYSYNRTNFAWQIVAGANYYVAPKISVFTEYKFLNYMDSGDRTGQQLVGAGLRFHF